LKSFIELSSLIVMPSSTLRRLPRLRNSAGMTS
jgi:hypothetical protein